MKKGLEQNEPYMEQLGVFDPLPNYYGEKVASLNVERIRYWIGYGCHISSPARQLLGYAGILPIPPVIFMNAWRRLQKMEKLARELQQKDDDADVQSHEEQTSESKET